MLYWLIVVVVGLIVFVVPYAITSKISNKVPVRPYYRLLLPVGWFIIGISISTLGISLVFLFKLDSYQVFAFTMIPIATLAIMLVLEQYLPWVFRYTQSNIEDTINFCKQFFGMANKSIVILSGSLSPYFYSDSRIIKALKDAHKREVKIEIAFHGLENEKQKKVIDSLSFLTMGVGLIPLPEQPEGPHFMIVDNKHIRVEKDHHITSRYGEVGKETKILNQVQYCSPMAAFGLNKRFINLKKAQEKGS